ncbi:MAG: hypothetical protein ACYDD1_05440 [Caulobacteraceae bacterium]
MPQPHEPTHYAWERIKRKATNPQLLWDMEPEDGVCNIIRAGDVLRVTLANGQTVWVRSLADKRAS